MNMISMNKNKTFKKMKTHRRIMIAALCVLGMYGNGNAQIRNEEVYEFPNLNEQNYRYHINIPDIDGYKTLKCDFHVHTVFSDGKVWPDQRVNEAWNEGLDVIAITDHIEYRPNKEIVKGDFNTSYEIAKKRGDAIGMMVIKGAEITREKPLGHLNALFLQNANKLDLPDALDAIDEAVKQGAYILWNHPGWPDDLSTIYPIHRELIAANKIHGVEVFNSSEVYPKVIDWCNEFGLAPFANTDIHYTSANLYRGRFVRPMTLVFAKEYTEEAVKEALFAGRTVACYNNILSGKEEFLKSLIKESLSVRVINEGNGTIEITNHSDIAYQIRYGNLMYAVPLYPNQTMRANIRSGSEVTFTNCVIGKDKYVVTSLW
jgi:histidinol phosphatase-like PHP family hydrolase